MKYASARSVPPFELHTVATPYGSRSWTACTEAHPVPHESDPSAGISIRYKVWMAREPRSTCAPPAATAGSADSCEQAVGHWGHPGGQACSTTATCPPKLPMRWNPFG